MPRMQTCERTHEYVGNNLPPRAKKCTSCRCRKRRWCGRGGGRGLCGGRNRGSVRCERVACPRSRRAHKGTHRRTKACERQQWSVAMRTHAFASAALSRRLRALTLTTGTRPRFVCWILGVNRSVSPKADSSRTMNAGDPCVKNR